MSVTYPPAGENLLRSWWDRGTETGENGTQTWQNAEMTEILCTIFITTFHLKVNFTTQHKLG